jgi:hypothetical protein
MRTPGTPPRPWPGWAHAALGALLFSAGLGAALLGQQVATSRRAWAVTRDIAQRISTESGARDLWAHNPALRQDYPDEATFLAVIREGRAHFGELPTLEPRAQAGSPWSKVASPWNLLATAQGTHGGWMQVQVQRPGPLEQPQGEGITLLAFSEDLAGLQGLRAARRERRFQARYDRIRQVAGRLASPGGTRDLWKQEPALHEAFPTPESLEREAERLRPRLRHLPPGSSDLHVRHLHTPFQDRVDVRWKAPEGGEVAMAWEGEALVDVHLEGAPSEVVARDPS